MLVEIIGLLLSLLSVAVGVHIKNSYVLAQKQKLVATKLNADLAHWKSVVADANSLRRFHDDDKIQALRKALTSAKESNIWDEMSKAKDEMYQEIKENYVEHHQDGLAEYAEMLKKQVSALPGGIDFLHRQADTTINSILNGKMFVNDDGASALGYFYAHTCVRLRMNVVDLTKEFMQLDSLLVNESGRFRSEIKSTYFSCLWKMMLVMVEMDILSEKVGPLENRSIHRMAWRNFLGKSC